MNSKIYFNPSWSISKKGVSIPLWASFTPKELIDSSCSPPILFIGGVHGDEPEGVWIAEALLNSLLTLHRRRHQNHHRRHPQKKQNWEQNWVILPCLNPEGYEKNERVNSSGVDLNRNFPSSDWTPEAKAPRYFPGEKPASEPEVRGVIQAIEIFKPKLIIHFHSWKPCVVYTGDPAKEIAKNISEHCGYPNHEDIGYPTPGSLGQFGWHSKQIPVICIEEQEGAIKDQVWPRFRWALMELIKKGHSQ